MTPDRLLGRFRASPRPFAAVRRHRARSEFGAEEMKIKRLPEHFQVEEVLRTRPGPSGTHAVYLVAKRGMTTCEAARALAAAARTVPARVSFAGLKDKHAATSQYMAVEGGPAKDFAGAGWEARFAGFRDAPLSGADIQANRFRIAVQDLTREVLRSIERRRRAMNLFGLVNYFGDQRFGSARHGMGFAAAEFARGRAEEGLRLAMAVEARKDSAADKRFRRTVAEYWGRWEECLRRLPPHPDRRAVEFLASPGRESDFAGAFARLPIEFQRFCVMAYQSFLWNETARELVESAFPKEALLRAYGAAGLMVFPAPDAPPPKLPSLAADARGTVASERPCPWNPGSWNSGPETIGSYNPDPKGADAKGSGAGSSRGGMPFPDGPFGADAADGKPRSPLLSAVSVPLASRKSDLSGPTGEVLARVLAREGIKPKDLRIGRLRQPFFASGIRPLAVPVTGFSMSAPAPDPFDGSRFQVELRFELPPGSYATVLLRMLIQARPYEADGRRV